MPAVKQSINRMGLGLNLGGDAISFIHK
jgi:serine/threonine protein kinase